MSILLFKLAELDTLDRNELESALLQQLEIAGLRTDEAKGLIDSWRSAFFESAGSRVVFLLKLEEYNLMLPMKCNPQPTERARVGLVLTEF